MYKLTQRFIDQLPPNTGRSRYAEYSDTEVTGLKLLVSRTGR